MRSHQIFLKKIESLSVPLTILFNQSITIGIFPNRFKIGKVIPIYKTFCKSKLSNYCPISILPFFSKVFETRMKKTSNAIPR